MAAAGSAEAICVGVRLRPLVKHEKGEKHCLAIDDNTVSILSSGLPNGSSSLKGASEKSDFVFDYAMDSTNPSKSEHVSQARCYELMAQKMVGHAAEGYSSCLICYGQTGTGKTMTIMGNMSPATEQGVLLRLLADLFKDIREQSAQGLTSSLTVQMLEVYNEKIKDLLVKCPCPPGWVCQCTNKVDVHMHPKFGVYLKGAGEETVETLERCIEVIDYGNSNKTVAATAMNAKSSRGHTVFKLKMERRGADSQVIASEVFFVDLAGRENEKTTQVTGERMVELTFINKSLMFLASCIQSLGAASPDAKRKSVTPTTARKDMSKFRNSKLTLLLSNALTGNSKTSLIGTLSPAAAHFEESLSTLKFASTVKNIKVEAKAKTGVDSKSLVAGLQEEIKSLKEQIALQAESRRSSEGDSPRLNGDELQRQLEAAQALSEDYQRKWEEEHLKYEKERLKRMRATKHMVVAHFSMAVNQHKRQNSLPNSLPGDTTPLKKEKNQGPKMATIPSQAAVEVVGDPDSGMQSDEMRAEIVELRRKLHSSNALCEALKAQLRQDDGELGADAQAGDSNCDEPTKLRRQLGRSKALCAELTAKRQQDRAELVVMRFRLAVAYAKLARTEASPVNLQQMQSMATSLAGAAGGGRASALNDLLPLARLSEAATDSRSAPQGVDEKFPEPMRGYMWKKSPHVLRLARPWDRRYVTLVCGRFSWWAPEEYAGDKSPDSRESDAKGYVDLPSNKCSVQEMDGTTTQIGLHVQGIAGNFTGGGTRTFVFDCDGSGRSRKDWITAIQSHITCSPRGNSDWVADILRSGVMKLMSARWLLQQSTLSSTANRAQLPAAALIEPGEAARLYRENGCLAVLT